MLKHFYNMTMLFDATLCNPNGDRIDNRPRIDAIRGTCFLLAESFKGRIRDAAVHLFEGEPGCRVFLRHPKECDLTLEDRNDEVAKLAKGKKADATAIACQEFFDNRTFGIVPGGGKENLQTWAGPFQMSSEIHSVDRVNLCERQITRQMKSRRSDLKKKKDDNGDSTEKLEVSQGAQFGDKYHIEYGLFVAHAELYPFRAERTGFSENDVARLATAMHNAWYYAASGSKRGMRFQGLWVYQHPNDKPATSPQVYEQFIKVGHFDATDDNPYPRGIEDYEGQILVDEKLPKKHKIKVAHIPADAALSGKDFKLRFK